MLGEVFEQKKEIPALVRFETRPVESKALSNKNGRTTCIDVDYVLVTPPYSKDCHVNKAEQWFENQKKNLKAGKIPKEWYEYWEKSYQAFKNGKEAPLSGTSIHDLTVLTPAQIKNLINIGINTIEMLAEINSEGLNRIGMGARDMQNKAKNWLKVTESNSGATIKITQLQTEVANLIAEKEALLEKVRILSTKVESDSAPAEVIREPISEITAADILDDESIVDQPSVMENAADVIEKTAELSLEAQYEAKFGKPPHHRMKEETIREKLRE